MYVIYNTRHNHARTHARPRLLRCYCRKMYKCTRNPRNALNYWVFSLYILEKLRTNRVQMYKKRLNFADRSGLKRCFSVIFHIISYVLYTLSGHRLPSTGKRRFRPWQPWFGQAEAAGQPPRMEQMAIEQYRADRAGRKGRTCRTPNWVEKCRPLQRLRGSQGGIE